MRNSKHSNGMMERFGFCHVISQAILAFFFFRHSRSVSFVDHFAFLSRFFYSKDGRGVPPSLGFVALLLMGIHFRLSWPQIRSGFWVVYLIWHGKLLTFFLQL